MDQFFELRDESTAPRLKWATWQRAVLGVLVLAALPLALISIRFPRVLSSVFLAAIVVVVVFIALWLAKKIKVSHKLVGSTLVVDRRYPKTNVSLKSYPHTIDLRSLCAAQKIGETRETVYQGQVYLFPPKLVLIYDAQADGQEDAQADGQEDAQAGGQKGASSRQEQVILRRPYVSGSDKDIQSLRLQLDSWNKICSAVENEALPDALALRWRSDPLYDRYWCVLLQAEVEYLQGKSTAPQMCLATIRGVINIIRGGGSVLLGVWTGISLFCLFVGVLAVGNIWLGFRFFVDDANRVSPQLLWLFLPTVLIAALYYILFLFEPLSMKVRREMDIRTKQARRLIEAGLTTEDLMSLLSMVEHQVDRVKHTLSTLTVATALPVLLTSLPKFFGTSTSRISDVVLVLSIVAFAVVQLYYFTQVRILQIAETNCLIAQSELGKAKT